jgi:hypothetical protein
MAMRLVVAGLAAFALLMPLHSGALAQSAPTPQIQVPIDQAPNPAPNLKRSDDGQDDGEDPVILSAALSLAVTPACRIMHLEFCRSRPQPVVDGTLEPATIAASPRGAVFFFKVQRWRNEWAVHNSICLGI